VQRWISRVYGKDHVRLFYGKSATGTADGSICEKVEREAGRERVSTGRLFASFLMSFLADRRRSFNAEFATATNR
jgi:hypothetical protein